MPRCPRCAIERFFRCDEYSQNLDSHESDHTHAGMPPLQRKRMRKSLKLSIAVLISEVYMSTSFVRSLSNSFDVRSATLIRSVIDMHSIRIALLWTTVSSITNNCSKKSCHSQVCLINL